MSLILELQIIQLIGFLFSETLHFLLLYLIKTKSAKQFGSYKILMASFSIFSIFYAFLEVITLPIMHISGTGLMLYASNSFFSFSKETNHFLSVFYCSSFGICVLFLSAHFFYRYSAVCSARLLKMLEGFKVFRLFIPITVLGSVMFIDICWFGNPSDFKSEYLRESLSSEYGEDSFKVGHISAVFYLTDSSSGTSRIFWEDCIGMLIVWIILFLSISTIIFFAVKTYRTVYSQMKASKKLCEIQRQLFQTLVIQSIIPLILMFLPTGFLLSLPFLDVKHVGKITNAPGVGASFYPALDALTAIFMIRDFRKAVLCRRPTVPKIRVSSIPDSFFTHIHT